jgi:hypothetical protein
MTQPIENEAIRTNEPCYRGNRIMLGKGETSWVASPYGLVRVQVCRETGYPIVEIYGVSGRSGVKYTKKSKKGMPMTLTPIPRKNGDA